MGDFLIKWRIIPQVSPTAVALFFSPSKHETKNSIDIFIYTYTYIHVIYDI